MTTKINLKAYEPLTVSRRQALATLVGVGLATGLSACKKGKARDALLLSDSSDENSEYYKTMYAVVERIFPGAGAAGALNFFAKLFERKAFIGVGRQFHMAVVVLNRLARKKYRKPLVFCSASEQDEMLVLCKDGKISAPGFDSAMFYKRLIVLTMESFLGAPHHGGNQGEVGWKLIGHKQCYFSPRRLEIIQNLNQGLPY
ncbi:MAG: gluconate 2-dehydrogenase subunit 3 family protein [Deltaproteobacteria bacterium]|nr:gluconate 2-dehydrogenase subunit 3 family protein [Deltaproteobacteria bacterium]